MSKFTIYPAEFWKKIQLNAGIVVRGFDPTDKSFESMLGATGGGLTFDPKPTYEDFGSDIDNVPPNTLQLKRCKSYDPTLTGTLKTIDADTAAELCPGSSVDGVITPASKLTPAMFQDVTILADYSEVNDDDTTSGAVAGYIAITIKNALNTTGFKWKTNKDGKGDFDFEIHGHYDLNAPGEPPFEIHVIEPTRPSLTALTVTSTAGTASGDTNIAVSGYTLGSGEKWMYQTAASTAPTVTYGQTCAAGWTQLTSGDDITPAAGHTKIAVVAVDAGNCAIAYGSATIVKAV